MDLPMDGLMCGDFPNALIPAVHPLFPKAGSQEVEPTVAGDSFPHDGGGTGPAAMVLVLGQLHAVPISSLQGLCTTLAVLALCHLSIPGWGCLFPPTLLYSPWPFSLLVSPSLPVPPVFADPATGLGEALIHHRAPRQLCQRSEAERGTQLWNKPLHDPV